MGPVRRTIAALAQTALTKVDWEADIAANPHLGRDLDLPQRPLQLPGQKATWYAQRIRTCEACDQHAGCPVWAKRERKTSAGCCQNQWQAYLKKPLSACLGDDPPRWLPVPPDGEPVLPSSVVGDAAPLPIGP